MRYIGRRPPDVGPGCRPGLPTWAADPAGSSAAQAASAS